MSDWVVLFIFSILAYGISNHFVYAHGPFHIYDKIRDLANKIHSNLGELFQCMICFPTWVGFILSIFNSAFYPEVNLTPGMILLGNYAPWWVIMIIDGFFASGIVWLIHTLQEALERSNSNE
jgi:ribosomal protein S19